MIKNKYRLTFLQKDIPAREERLMLYGGYQSARPAEVFEVETHETHFIDIGRDAPSSRNDYKPDMRIIWRDDEDRAHSRSFAELVWFKLENL